MKKTPRTAVSLAATWFAVIALQLHREAIAETQGNLPRVTIFSTDGVSHAPYLVMLVNLTTNEMIPIPRETDKFGAYPNIYGNGGGAGGVDFNPSHNFLIHICRQGGGSVWGVNSSVFHMPLPEITLTAGFGCPAYALE